MTKPSAPASLAERWVDREADAFSLRDLLTSLFMRPRLFLIALLLPPLIAVLVAASLPLDWEASAKILIRYSATDGGLLKDLLPDAKLGLSGTTSAELLKSTPVVARTITSVGVTEQDLYRKPMDLLSDRVSALLGRLLPQDAPGTPGPAADAAHLQDLVKKFEDSLNGTAKATSAAKPIEILEKNSQVPESMKLDELITLSVKSFNREKVAAMANGLGTAFIDEYYRLYTEEAARQSRYLEGQVATQRKELQALEHATPADLASGRLPLTGGRELISRDVPILASMANQLMERESNLARARQIYADDAPEVERLRSQVDELRFMLKKQERIEIGKQVLEQLRVRSYQASSTESIFRNHLVPISIIEPASTPRFSGAKRTSRLLISGITGTLLGLLLAITLVILLGMIDPRIRVRRDLEKLSTLELLAQVPAIGKSFDLQGYRTVASQAGIEESMLQLIARIGRKREDGRGKVLLLCAPSPGDGSTFCSLALALTLTRNRQTRVCLIDADFNDPRISQETGQRRRIGLIEAILGQGAEALYQDKDSLLTIMGSGDVARRSELGYYADEAASLFDTLRNAFDYIVVDAGAILKSSEAVLLGQLADAVVVVASSGVTRKGLLQAALARLDSSRVQPAGLLLNGRREVLPRLIYKNV